MIGMFLGAVATISTGRGVVAIAAWTLGLGVVAGVVSLVLLRVMSESAGAGFLAFTQPRGASSPSEDQFSYQYALAARGDVDAALASYESLLQLASPQDVAVRLRAADLCVERKRDARRAAELYREVQRMPSVSSSNFVYATNRLISLYLGVLADPGKALGELRRLIDRDPTSDVATHARKALANLKSEMPVDG
jgi:hypothetical protein